jgi:hypothetical protein
MPVEDESFVAVQVPRLALPDVLELIAQRLRSVEAQEEGSDHETIELDESLVRRMYEESQENCQWPSSSPHWRPRISPLVAIISPRWWPRISPPTD